MSLLVAIACEPAAEAPPAGLREASDGFAAAWDGDDPQAVAPFFADDATAAIGDDTFRGRAEIEAGWLIPYVPIISDLRLMEESAHPVGEDWRSEGTYSHDVAMPDGEILRDQRGRYTFTWTRDADGHWRLGAAEVRMVEPDGPDEPDEPDEPDGWDGPAEG